MTCHAIRREVVSSLEVTQRVVGPWAEVRIDVKIYGALVDKSTLHLADDWRVHTEPHRQWEPRDRGLVVTIPAHALMLKGGEQEQIELEYAMAEVGESPPDQPNSNRRARLDAHFAHELVEFLADGSEGVVQLQLEPLAQGPAKVCLDSGEETVEVVIPRLDNRSVRSERGVEITLFTGRGCDSPGEPVDPPHPVEPTVKENADLLERLGRRLEVSLGALHGGLLSPRALLKVVAQSAANDRREREAGDEKQKRVVGHS